MLVLATLLAAAVAAAPHPTGSVDPVGWLAGAWEGEIEGLKMEETWLPPRGGTMLGLHRDVKGARTVGFEFLRIAADADGRLAYFASPQGRAATVFRLAEAGDRRVVFTNPAHDFPQRITYWLDGRGALHARVDALDGTGAQEWTWTRSR